MAGTCSDNTTSLEIKRVVKTASGYGDQMPPILNPVLFVPKINYKINPELSFKCVPIPNSPAPNSIHSHLIDAPQAQGVTKCSFLMVKLKWINETLKLVLLLATIVEGNNKVMIQTLLLQVCSDARASYTLYHVRSVSKTLAHIFTHTHMWLISSSHVGHLLHQEHFLSSYSWGMKQWAMVKFPGAITRSTEFISRNCNRHFKYWKFK